MRPGNHRRFEDKLPEDYSRPGINPYVASHREFGDELLPASDAKEWRGRWHELFGREAPLHLEVGSGNGFYLSGMAELHPECDWVGVELRFKRVVLVARKLRAAGLNNARIVRYDARLLEELFMPGSLAGVHINHPDPWERESRRHHRLIDRAFLELLSRLCAPGAELRLKTDFGPHVKALLKAVDGLPWAVVGTTEDVDRDGPPWPDDVVTNYQRKARLRGAPVHAALLRRNASGSAPSTAAPEPQPAPQPVDPASPPVGSEPSTHSSMLR
jgi:tRNA (guanine-N7-)-methyltransferase